MWDGDLTGEVVDGRYALGELYGSGGMAEVYRAFDTTLDRKVAIKLFQGAAMPEDAIRLDREARILGGLRCPGVVAVYDTGSFRGRPFYVMQAVEGGTLRRRMREALAPEVVAHIGSQVAGVLAHVHANGVVHRDVKPSNILFDLAGRRVYLADFGLALQAQVTRVTRTGIVVGTASYLSPEQVRGADVTPASDVYALGLVLLECLTGRLEYPGGDTEAALARLHREPRVPANLPAPWPDVLTAMTSNPAGKRPTAAECVTLLEQAEQASAGVAPLVEVRETVRAPQEEPAPHRRRTGAMLVGGSVLAVAVAALVVVLNLRDDPAADESRPDNPATSAEPVAGTTDVSPQTVLLPPSTVTVVEQAPGTPGTEAVPSSAQDPGQPADPRQVKDPAQRTTTTTPAAPSPTTKTKEKKDEEDG